MAKRKPNGNDNRQTMDKFSYRQGDDGEWYRAVCDETSQAILEAILGALGGSSNTTTTISNVNIISAGVEQSLTLPANTKKFIIRSRNRGRLRLAYALGGTGTDYLSIPTGSSFVDSEFRTSSTIYFQSTKPGDVIEIVAYS